MTGRFSALLLCIALTAFVALWALTLGNTRLPLPDILDAMFRFDGSTDHLVITSVRVPRVATGLVVGASLAVAGAIMQAVTGNPLASPGILGVNAGAAFAVVCALVTIEGLSRDAYVWFAFIGAALASASVYGLASFGRGGASPVRLALSGAIFSTFLASLTASILIFDAGALGTVRHWTAGSLSSPDYQTLIAIAPYALLGLILSLLISGQVMTLSLGSDVARTVGQSVTVWRLLCAGCVVLLAGSSVALAGPISFVGLVTPHIVRMLAGPDYRWIIPFSAIGGALLVVGADAAVRWSFPESDIPIGVTIALIGAPFFIYLARYRIGRSG